VRAALEDRLARRIGVRQHRGIDVDHDLIPLARRTRIDSPVQGRLGDERERVRLLLLDGGRFRRTVHVPRSRGTVREARSRGTASGALRPCPPMQGFAGRGQRLNHHSAGLRLQPGADDDHTAFIVIHVQGAVPVAPRRLLRFRLAIHPAPAADDALDMLGGAGPPVTARAGARPPVV